MTRINRNAALPIGGTGPSDHSAPSHPRPEPQLEGPAGLRRRTEAGHVPGDLRPGPSQAAVPMRPPRPPSRLPQQIEGLSMRLQEVSQAVAAIRGKSLSLSQAEQHLPGLSRLIHHDGHWQSLKELDATANELPVHQRNGVMQLVANINHVLSNGRVPAIVEPAPDAPGQAAHAPLPGNASTAPFPARFGLPEQASASHAPALEIPSGLTLDDFSAALFQQQPGPGNGPAH